MQSDQPDPVRDSSLAGDDARWMTRDDAAIERAMMFDFEAVGEDRFRIAPIPSSLLRLYGGQVFAQGLTACQLTVPAGKLAHSAQAYYLQPGDTTVPLDFEVERLTDGRSFAVRRVTAMQQGTPVLTLSASFQIEEAGREHQFVMPDVPRPDGLKSLAAYVAELGDALPRRHWPFWKRPQQFDWRPVEPYWFTQAPVQSDKRHFWVRLNGRLGDDPAEHQRYLAYASDLHILHAGLGPLGIGWASDYLQSASLDHAIWFHDRFRIDEWMLYVLDSPATSGGRALGRGNFFRADGRLVATVSQQGLIRMLDAPRTGRL